MSTSSSVVSTANNSVKHSSSGSTNNTSDKEPRKESKKERDSTEKVITIKEKGSSKESKRDSKEDGEIRKRDRGEKRRDRERNKITTPPSYYNDRYAERAVSPSSYVTPADAPMYVVESNDRFHDDNYDERDRDLSSISNSSKGSTNRRSQESPDAERELKRRRVDNSKVCAHRISLSGVFRFV